MNPSRRGLSNAVKAGVVVVLAIVVLGAVYFVPGLSTGGGSQTTSSVGGTLSTVRGNQTQGVYSLIKAFSKMQLEVDTNVPNQGATNRTYSYAVLGKGTINSTQYTRVEFVTVGIGDNVVMWFNSTGGVARVDVLGQRNYTGSGVPNLPYVMTYSNLFGVIPTVTNNATLFSMLTKYSEGGASIGPTSADVTTYVLSTPSQAYSSLTVKVATVPAKNVVLATYVFAKAHDGSTELIEVTSITP